MSKWPVHGTGLIPGVNDTWNEFQKFNNGKTVTSSDWRSAKNVLNAQYREHLEQGGKPNIALEPQNRYYSLLLSAFVQPS